MAYQSAIMPPEHKDRPAKKIISLAAAEQQRIIVESPSELGLARLFSSKNQDVVRRDWQRGIWLYYDGTRWIDDQAAIINLMKTIPAEISALGFKVGGDSGSVLKKFALKAESRNVLVNALKLAESEVEVCVKNPDAFDSDTMIFNVENGTVDLKDGEPRVHDAQNLITKIAPVRFVTTADCPRWKKFLEEVFADKALIDYMRRVFGYCLTGKAIEQVLFFLYGIGANGKSVLLNVLLALLGSYGRTVTSEILMLRDRTGNTNTPELAQLPGLRAVVLNELEQGRRANEALIKSLTGGEPVQACAKYGAPFTFTPQFKMLVAGNHKPAISGTDDGIWRRIHLIPFTQTFTGERRDPNLEEKLTAELPGILNWAVQGCLEWQREGLNPPPIVKNATTEYRNDQDTVGRWMQECCTLNPLFETSSTELLKSFNRWAEDNGHRKISSKYLGSYLDDQGFEWKKNSIKYWLCIGLNDSYSVAAS